ncbi:hypothetical protein R11007_02821 [Ralstonia holmesii]|nr:hypothetical protein R11007_02821 [Ralstonia sp. LMG 32967]
MNPDPEAEELQSGRNFADQSQRISKKKWV